MSLTIVTSFHTLMRYAKEEAEARKSGDIERLKKAIEKHEDYRQLCLKADKMLL